jgi:hypothetical protein
VGVENAHSLILHHLDERILFTEGRIDELRNQIGQGAFRVIDFAAPRRLKNPSSA